MIELPPILNFTSRQGSMMQKTGGQKKRVRILELKVEFLDLEIGSGHESALCCKGQQESFMFLLSPSIKQQHLLVTIGANVWCLGTD
jgi:hypothetical protein